MSKPLITICSVNYNSADFLLNTLYCLEKITKNEYQVIIRDNNSKINDYLKLQQGSQKYNNVEVYRVENFQYTGGLAHGIAINELIQKIDTKYGVIFDADCTFLLKNWDELLINEVNIEYPIIGTPASYNTGEKRTNDFPLMYGVLFISSIMKEINVDFKPKENAGKFLDVGYQIKEKLIEHNYKGKMLEQRNTRFVKTGPFREHICVEYYLEGHKTVFGSHFGRGSTLGKGKYLSPTSKKKIGYSIPLINNFLLKRRGEKEKRDWIKICQKIVNDQ